LYHKNPEALRNEFSLQLSPDSKHFLTGGMKQSAHLLDASMTTNTTFKVQYDTDGSLKNMPAGKQKYYNKHKLLEQRGSAISEKKNKASRKKVLLNAWSPQEKGYEFALGYKNCIYLYKSI